MLTYEIDNLIENYKLIAGVDEAGRGPLAGPVSVGACIMPLEPEKLIPEINDSKKLTEKKREELYKKIVDTAICYKVVFIDEETIDEINILNATKQGMIEAINGLEIKPDIALIDAVKLPIDVKTESIIKGDAKSYNIAAASILAKVSRDRYMVQMDSVYPEYNFKKHKGYGTKEHIENLKKYGPCPMHRKSFIKHFVSENE